MQEHGLKQVHLVLKQTNSQMQSQRRLTRLMELEVHNSITNQYLRQSLLIFPATGFHQNFSYTARIQPAMASTKACLKPIIMQVRVLPSSHAYLSSMYAVLAVAVHYVAARAVRSDRERVSVMNVGPVVSVHL